MLVDVSGHILAAAPCRIYSSLRGMQHYQCKKHNCMCLSAAGSEGLKLLDSTSRIINHLAFVGMDRKM